MSLRKDKALWVAVIALFLLNSVTIVTLFYNKNHKNRRAQLVVAQNVAPMDSERLFEELQFNEEQKLNFTDALNCFRTNARDLNSDIAQCQNDIWSEINKKTINNNKIDYLHDKLSTLYSEQKRLALIFYVEITKDCTSHQKQILQKSFKPLFMREGQNGNKPRARDRVVDSIQQPKQMEGRRPAGERGSPMRQPNHNKQFNGANSPNNNKKNN